MTTLPAAPSASQRVRWFMAAPPQVLVALIMTALVSLVVFAVSELAASHVRQVRSEALLLRERATHVGDIHDALIQAESAQRGYLLTSDQRYLQPFKDAAARAEKASVELKASTRGAEAETAASNAIVELANRRLDEMRVTTSNAEQGRRDLALELLRSGIGVQAMEEVTQRTKAFEGDLLRQLGEREVDVVESMTEQRIGVALVVVLNLVFLAILANMLIRQFMLSEAHSAQLQQFADGLERTVAERTASLEALSTHLQASSEREKGQLARDLHDELGGILTSAKIDIAWIEGHSKSADPDLVTRLRRLSNVLDEAVDMKRRVVENLRPSLLDHLGLGAAIDWYVGETAKNAGLEVDLIPPPDEPKAPPELAIAIFRLVQEGMTNTIRHARASNMTIAITLEPEGYRVMLGDDGIGIVDFRPGKFTHGLAGMSHRARALGGSFEIDTQPGKGTRIEAFFPRHAAPVAEVRSPLTA